MPSALSAAFHADPETPISPPPHLPVTPWKSKQTSKSWLMMCLSHNLQERDLLFFWWKWRKSSNHLTDSFEMEKMQTVWVSTKCHIRFSLCLMASNESGLTFWLERLDTLMSVFNYSHFHSGWAFNFMTEAHNGLLKCPFLQGNSIAKCSFYYSWCISHTHKKNVSRFSVLELMRFVPHVITGHKNANEETLQSSSYIFFCERLDTSPPVEYTSKRKITGWKWCRAAAKWFASACDICFTVCIWNQLSQLIKLAVSPPPSPRNPTPPFRLKTWKISRVNSSNGSGVILRPAAAKGCGVFPYQDIISGCRERVVLPDHSSCSAEAGEP